MFNNGVKVEWGIRWYKWNYKDVREILTDQNLYSKLSLESEKHSNNHLIDVSGAI